MNIMPKVIYEALEYPALSPTTMLVQLADSTIRYPEGIAEHIFVRVRDSFVLADFVVMDMEGDLGVDLVFGRPFLRSAKARIDVGKGEIRLCRKGGYVFQVQEGRAALHDPTRQ